MKRRISLVLVLVFLLSMCVVPASAAEDRASKLIENCTSSVKQKSNGDLKISFTVTANGTVDKLGATFINLYCDGSIVATFSSSDYSTMMGSNTDIFTGSVTYSDPEPGVYYAYVRGYAKDGSSSDTANCYSSNLTVK